MRTQEQIAERVKNAQSFFGFDVEVLSDFLDASHVRPFLKPDVDPSTWDTTPNTREVILARMAGYLDFAFGKALDHRGLSARRSIEKVREYLWLLEDDELVEFSSDDANYPNYGMPILVKIAEKYFLPVPDGPALQNMVAGRKCRKDCDEGCS